MDKVQEPSNYKRFRYNGQNLLELVSLSCVQKISLRYFFFKILAICGAE
jgi:hypothetical protein